MAKVCTTCTELLWCIQRMKGTGAHQHEPSPTVVAICRCCRVKLFERMEFSCVMPRMWHNDNFVTGLNRD